MAPSLPLRHSPEASSPLLSSPSECSDHRSPRRPRLHALLLSSALTLLAVVVVFCGGAGGRHETITKLRPGSVSAVSRGRAAGVSEKSSRGLLSAEGGGAGGGDDSFQWTNDMLQWQRTGFHFQPLNYWMNGWFLLINEMKLINGFPSKINYSPIFYVLIKIFSLFFHVHDFARRMISSDPNGKNAKEFQNSQNIFAYFFFVKFNLWNGIRI